MVFEKILGHLLINMKTQVKTIPYILLFFILAGLFSSCVSTQSILIEVPQKPKNEVPESVQSLLLVARMVDGRYNDLESDSLQRIFYKQKFDYDTIVNDVSVVDTTLKALGELLFESGRFDFVIPENRFLPFERNSFLTREMPWDEVDQLCELYQTDAVLSLDHFKTRVATSFGRETFFNPYESSFFSGVEAEMKISYEALFRIYDPETEKVIIREFMRDTIVWVDNDVSIGELFSHFTPVKTALHETGIAVALDFADKISTSWRQERRTVFFTGDSGLKDAAQFARTNQWEPAMALWREIAEKSKSKSVKSKAELNLAVGYELQGNLDEAISWGLKSYETMFRTTTYEYLETLKRRKNELNK